MRVVFGLHVVELVQGDITDQLVDAIVNAANADLAGGGGVDGAIHQRGGPAIMAETARRYPLGCPPGDAVVSSAGTLAARFVFHAVGPIWQGGHRGESTVLRASYRRCLELAVQHECQSIAFPALSTGAYRYPLDLAAEQSLDEVLQTLTTLTQPLEVRFVLFDEGTWSAFARVLEQSLR